MVDLATAMQHLLLGGRKHPLPSPSLSMEQLDEGVVHADYGDSGHVFRISITQVPRVQVDLEPARIGEVDVAGIGQVQVHLLKVELANHLTVVLHGRAPADQSGRQVEERVVARLQGLQIRVADDVGTVYRLCSGEGGAERTTTSIERFLPLPPADARRLLVSVVNAGAFVGSREVTLPTS